MRQDVAFLEKGDIYFFYRPRVQKECVHTLEDVQRLYLVLKGRENPYYRLIVVGKKKLPSNEESQVEFAFVDLVSKDSKMLSESFQERDYKTKTRGERHLSDAKLLAEGKYSLIRDESGFHLVYQLDQVEELDQLQKQFNLDHEGSWIVSVKNPLDLSEKGLSSEKKAHFSEKLLNLFQGRRFISLSSSDYLNYPGAELLLIAEKLTPKEKWGREIKNLFCSFQHREISEVLTQ